jgi:hypothetical protein
MRSLAVLVAILPIAIGSAISQSSTYRTIADHVACATLESYKEQLALAVSGDKQAWASYLGDRMNGCIFLRANLEVYVANAPGLGIIKIRLKGSPVWIYTSTQAVRR